MAVQDFTDLAKAYRFRVYFGKVGIGCSQAIFLVQGGLAHLTLERALLRGHARFVDIARRKAECPEVLLVIPLDDKGIERQDRRFQLFRPCFDAYKVQFDASDSGVLLERLMFKSTVWEVDLEGAG